MQRALFIFIFSVVSLFSFAQTDLELAEYYYNNGEYEQAKLYYEKIYKSNKTTKVYNNFMSSLVALGELETAEKVIKKKLKQKGNNATVYVDLGDLYKKFDKIDDAEEQFKKGLKELQAGRSNAIRLANSYIKLNEFDYALQTYNKAKRISNDGYGFHYEMANLQGMMGNHEEMVASFLELLNVSPNYIQTVQNSLNRNLNIQENEDNADMLRIQLLKSVQKYPNVPIYNELLIWLFMQKKDFSAALVQAKALDKRLDENGFRLVDLAKLATNNEDYETAHEAYSAVISKGPTCDYYITAKMENLQVMYIEYTNKPDEDIESIKNLETAYELALDELGITASTAILVKELAHIQGFHLQNTEDAIERLNTAIEIPGLYSKIQAICKLELGDILVLEGDIWEASLLYSQVELDFKEDQLGHEAKLRNAKISYYTGDFEWAQAQLDVLKASTSKLISNDAIDLSLLITDNYNLDTITTPMLMFAQAELLSYQNRTSEAMLKADSIVTLWPGHTLSDEILMLKAEIYENKGNFEMADTLYQEVVDLYFMDILADDALFRLADLNHYIFHNESKAQKLYEKLILEFPGSLYVVEARKRFRALRGDAIN